MKSRISMLVFLPVCLAYPTPAHAMIELMPSFLFVSTLLIMAMVALVSLFLKRFMIRRWFHQGAVPSWARVSVVTCAEAFIMIFSMYVVIARIELFPPGDAWEDFDCRPFFLQLFAIGALLYSIIAIIPNMWLLHDPSVPSGTDNAQGNNLIRAWLIGLPVPGILAMCVFVLMYFER
jgi:hypothetical protein